MATNQKSSECGPKFLEYASAWPPTPCSDRTSGLDGSPDSMQRVRISAGVDVVLLEGNAPQVRPDA